MKIQYRPKEHLKKHLFATLVFLGTAWSVYAAIHFQTRAWVDEVWAVHDPAFKLLTGLDPTFREYGLRSWIPPFILWFYLKALWVVGIRHGTAVLPIVRVTTALFTCAGFAFYAWALGRSLKLRNPSWLAALVLFFIPDLVHYGATSELSVLGMPFLLAGLSLLLIGKDRLGWPLLAVAALIRFQYGVFPASLLIWYLYRRETRKALELAGVGAAVLLFDFVFESWRYGHAILPLWTYFTANTVGGLAAEYGVTPFYFAFELLWRMATEPVFLLICVVLPTALRRLPMLAGASLLFFLIHVIVGHKEYRFFYGAVVLLGGLSAAVFQKWYEEQKSKKKIYRARLAVLSFVVLFAGFVTWRASSKTGWREFEIPAALETAAGSQPDYHGSITYGWSGVRYGGRYTTYSARPYVFAQSREELRARNLNPMDYNYVVTTTSEPAPCRGVFLRRGDGLGYWCTAMEIRKLLRR